LSSAKALEGALKGSATGLENLVLSVQLEQLKKTQPKHCMRKTQNVSTCRRLYRFNCWNLRPLFVHPKYCSSTREMSIEEGFIQVLANKELMTSEEKAAQIDSFGFGEVAANHVIQDRELWNFYSGALVRNCHGPQLPLRVDSVATGCSSSICRLITM
jgi:hypothetical protein